MEAELFNYLAQMMPHAQIDCDGCGMLMELGKAVENGTELFCKQDCADKSRAILLKEQTNGQLIDGWWV